MVHPTYLEGQEVVHFLSNQTQADLCFALARYDTACRRAAFCVIGPNKSGDIFDKTVNIIGWFVCAGVSELFTNPATEKRRTSDPYEPHRISCEQSARPHSRFALRVETPAGELRAEVTCQAVRFYPADLHIEKHSCWWLPDLLEDFSHRHECLRSTEEMAQVARAICAQGIAAMTHIVYFKDSTWDDRLAICLRLNKPGFPGVRRHTWILCKGVVFLEDNLSHPQTERRPSNHAITIDAENVPFSVSTLR